MNSFIKQIVYLIIIFTTFSCFCQVKATPEKTVNSVLNKQYLESRQSFLGKLDSAQLQEIRSLISKELNTEIAAGKSILINYSQKATNCLTYNKNVKISLKSFDHSIEISNRISKKYNAIDFFVFSENVFYKEQFEKQKKFIKDSSFFYDNVFTLHENCEAFFILKPNGEFMKYYGEDYFTVVENFLKSK